MSEQRTKFYRFLSDFNRLKWGIAVKALLTGAVAGLITVLYRLLIEHGTAFAVACYAYFREHPVFLIPWALGAVIAGLFVAWLVKLEPSAAGSGIPQVEGAVLLGMELKWRSVLAVRFLAGGICGLFGLSLGREGPSIQIGAAGAKAVSGLLGRSKVEENYLITGGAAAGLAAAFNAPLSGVIFALEEVHRNFSPTIMLTATAASLVADFVSKYFFGLTPELHFTQIPQLPIHMYFWMLPLGALTGFVGGLLNRALLAAGPLSGKLLPARWRPAAVMLLSIPCGLFLPLTLGGGRDLIEFAQTATGGISLLLVLLAVKFLFTCASFGSGVPGGIFMPILAIGTLTGSVFGIACVELGLVPAQYIPDFAVCAMTAALAASVKAPITAVLLTVEMTGTLVHMLPVAACALAALLVSDLMKVEPIYEALLNRSVEKEREAPKAHEAPEGKNLMEIPVELGSCAAGRRIDEIGWPVGTLIVSLMRGNRDIIPRGETTLLPGDYLVVLYPQGQEKEVRAAITDLCHEKF